MSPSSVEIVLNQGIFTKDTEKVKLHSKESPANFVLSAALPVGIYDLLFDYIDSSEISAIDLERIEIVATDKCLTDGLDGIPADGLLDFVYTIETPVKTINFFGITNDECKFSTSVHIDSIGSGLLLTDFGLA